MTKIGRMGTWAAIGMAALLGLAVVPAFASAFSPSIASSVAAASTPAGCPPGSTTTGGQSGGHPDTQWAYGGEGYSIWSFSFHNVTFSYNSTFGWTVIFTVVTNSTTGVTMLEEQRTLGITVWANFTTPRVTASYLYHAYESDGAFANATNHSTVYVNGSPVAALGLLNASVAACSTVHQAISVANETVTRNGNLDVNGSAAASVSFSPSLGLIPLNLSGVEQWNSSSTATTAASWNVTYAYQQLNGSSGTGSRTGSLGGTYPVSLTGYQFEARHAFWDQKPRTGVILILQGPFNCYDGFILLPRDFDFFGTAVQGYSPYGFGTASISGENLYVSRGPGGLGVTAADQSFAAVNTGMNGFMGPSTMVSSDAFNSPSATVYGQPMPVSEALAIDHSLTANPTLVTHTAPSHISTVFGSGSGLVAVVAGAVIVAIVGVVTALVWTSSHRRHANTSAPLTDRGTNDPSDQGSGGQR